MDSLIQRSTSSSFSVFSIPQKERDLLSELLADKRSENTRIAYERDLRDFFAVTSNQKVTPQLVSEFLGLPRFQAIALVLQYKAHLIDRKLSEATVNRRLAALKSLVRFAQKVGQCDYSLEEITGEKIKAYRDTSGVGKEAYRTILESQDRTTLAGKRNYAILRLLWDNALRRAEVCKLNQADFDPDRRTLKILGKGRGTQQEAIGLSQEGAIALTAWLEVHPYPAQQPVFISLSPTSEGHRLTGQAIYQIVREAAEKAGIKKIMSPHRCRHSSITAALDATGGDVRRVQKLSRHAKLETIALYDDHRQGHQQEITDLLGEITSENSKSAGVG